MINLNKFTKNSSGNKYLYTGLACLLTFIAVLIPNSQVYSQLDNDRMRISYDQCTASLILRFKYKNVGEVSCTDNDELRNLEITYTDGSTKGIFYIIDRTWSDFPAEPAAKKTAYESDFPGITFDRTSVNNAAGDCDVNFQYVAPQGTFFQLLGRGDLAENSQGDPTTGAYLKIPLPPYSNPTINISVDGVWQFWSTCCRGGTSSSFWGSPVSPISSPTTTLNNANGFMASTTLCNTIELTWDQFSQLPSSEACTVNDRSLYIDVRNPNVSGAANNWRPINQVYLNVPVTPQTFSYYYDASTNPVVYTPNSFLRVEDHEFRIRHVHTPNRYRTLDSGGRLSTGSIATPPPAPTITSVTEMGCEGDDMVIMWSYSSTPDMFKLERATNETFTQNLTSFNIAGNLNEFTDNTIQLSTMYYYRLRAVNNCPSESEPSAPPKMGFIEGTPLEPSSVTASASTSGITVSWQDNSDFESGFIIERTFPGGGSAFIIDDIDPDIESYFDSDVNQCVTYTYRIKTTSICYPAGVGTRTASAIIASDLSGTFPSGGFNASKGSFTDKVELSWTNNKPGQTNTIKIFRRILESGNPFTLLTTLNSASGFFNDLAADAGELYEYEIVAEGPCENNVVESNRLQTIGFRRKTGIVTGKVTYGSGINVANVKITAGDPTNNTYPSISMSAAQIGTIQNNNTLNTGQELIVETWFKPDANALSFDLIKKNGSYGISYNSSTGNYGFMIQSNNGNGSFEVFVSGNELPVGDWNHISGMLFQNALSVYVNGVLRQRIQIPAGTGVMGSGSNVIIGNGFSGKIKELRIWNIGKSDLRIVQDYSRFLAGNEAGLKVYLNAGERKGKYAYDFSRVGSDLNNNHALLSAYGMWDDIDSPESERLSIAAFTNSSGEYSLILPFAGSGQNFVLRPVFGQHIFDPSSRPAFIGDGATVQNNIDFEDISTFSVGGQAVFYGTNCPSEGLLVKIDGAAVTIGDNAVFTDDRGMFDIEVPIGRHEITLEKNGHVFSLGRFPEDPNIEWNFQADVSGVPFVDSTLRKVIGRVVGGTREGNKAPGLGRSNNNIGIANITFEPQAALACGWIEDPEDDSAIPKLDTTIMTVDTSGEYEILLPPMEYLVGRPEIKNNDGNIQVIDDPLISMDLSNIPFPKSVIDTIVRADLSLQIDSTQFHKRQDFIYRSPLDVEISELDGSPLAGDDSYTYTHSKLGTFDIDLVANPLPYPVFTQSRVYNTLLSTFEKYVNYDGPEEVLDKVPVTTGNVIITNDLAIENSLTIDLSDFDNYDGDTTYSFVGGQPNITGDFTKSFQVSLSSGTKSDTWDPNGAIFRGYVVGVKDIEESDFTTQGPELVDYILRDPPGSQSFAQRTLSTSTATENSYEWNVGGGVDVDKTIYGGTKFNLGIGYSTTTEIEATIAIGLKTEFSGGEGFTVTETITNEETWSTSPNPLLAGASSDLFIGTSRNYLFGVSTRLAIVPETACSNTLIECIGNAVDGFRIATQKSLALAGEDFETEFIYTASHIETYEIPQLMQLRNNFMENSLYHEVFGNSEDPCYGLNNDDPRWFDGTCSTVGRVHPPTSDPLMTTAEDTIGPSYIFRDPLSNMPDTATIDSVRLFNQQIRLWIEALAYNEEQKVFAVDNPTNYSYAGGGSSFSRSQGISKSFTESKSFEFNFTESLAFKVGGKVAGAGFDESYSVSLTQKRTEAEKATTDTTQTVSFTISDDSEWDDFTFDVYDGSASGGPIFKTLGGRTSCPHEGRVTSKYYNPGTILSPGSIQLEQPTLSIEPRSLTNIPLEESGIFTAFIGNENQVGEGWGYRLSLLNESNPGGALIINSGTSELSQIFNLSAGQEIPVQIIVEAGASYTHEDLLFVLSSTCQYQQGLSAERDIADSAYFSISFIPECTSAFLQNPSDNWVINNGYNDTITIDIGGYDYNYLNFDNLKFQTKLSSEGQDRWVTRKTFYHPTNDTMRFQNHPEYNYLSNNTINSVFDLNVKNLSDGEYDFRVVSDCLVANKPSDVHRGYIDTQNPHAFGTPSPADGILDPGDDIIIRFNEDIDPAFVSEFNFDIRAKLNGTTIRQQENLAFDGTSDFGTIPEYRLDRRDMTIEFWARRGRLNQNEVVLSQGLNTQDQLVIGFDATNKLFLKLGGGQPVSSNFSITDNDWHFYAVTYGQNSRIVQFYVDNTPRGLIPNFSGTFTSSGPIIIGKNSSSNNEFFQGNLQEIRIWSIVRDQGSIGETSGITLSGREPGLIGNWPLDDSWGTSGKEKVRSRHLEIMGATWNVDQEGDPSHTYILNGIDEYLILDTAGQLGTTPSEDLTIEAWFKTQGNGEKQTILSNGIPSVMQSSRWAVSLTPTGELIIENNGNSMTASSNLANDSWHHFAMVLERNFSISVYVDGQLVETENASIFSSFGGASLVLGAQVDGFGLNASFSQYFNGLLDDIRMWNVARKPEQVSRDFINQLSGDEFGLLAYYPFDFYEELNGGPPSLTATLEDQVIDTSRNRPNFDLAAMGGDFSTISPTIKLPRRVKIIVPTASVNNDEIFIDLDSDPATIENVIVDITVKAIRDYAGNYMQSPETWTAFIDKNQVFWETEYLQFEKNVDDPLSFTSTILNTGGSVEQFTISNLPSWLTASPMTGTLNPNSSKVISFNVIPGINIGEYEQDIFVTTASFGFNERLLLDLKVFEDPPEWAIDPTEFSFGMNIVGQLRVNEILSTDDEDIVSVWVNNELRGLGNVAFDDASGKYLVFLSVFSNNNSPNTDSLEFRAWDASRGRILVGLEPMDRFFANNDILGTLSAPLPIEATVLAERSYNLQAGWNWISFPLASDELNDVGMTLSDLSPIIGDQVKSQSKFNTYNGTQWEGNLNSFNTEDGYKIKLSSADAFTYSGTFNNPNDEPIAVDPGWNWVGVKSEFNIDVETVLNSLQDLQTGDVIKGQGSFAQYDEEFGWGGNLGFLEPQKGYMLYYNTTGTIRYPANGFIHQPEQRRSVAKAGKTRVQQKSLQYTPGKYSSNMSLTADVEECLVLDPDIENVDLSDWLLVAYAEGEIRGVTSASWHDQLNKFTFYLTIEGDDSAQINFKLIHTTLGTIINLEQEVTYNANQITGSLRNPFRFICGGLASCDDVINYGTNDIDETQADISISAISSIRSDAQLPSGILFRFSAGNNVEFMNGFEAAVGSVLEAFIESCNN